MATQHLRLVVRGGYKPATLSVEEWQFGIRMRLSNAAADDYGDLPTDVDWIPAETVRNETDWDINAAFGADLPNINSFDAGDYLNDVAGPALDTFIKATGVCNDNAVLYGLTLYGYTNGRVAQTAIGPARATLDWKPGVRPDGQVTGAMLPVETSICASLMTSVLGRRGRGRIYLPPNGTGCLSTSDGSINSTYTGNVATAAAQLMRDLIADPVALGGVNVEPIVTGDPFTRYGRINAVRVGNVMDSQRRRRRSLVETYASATV